MLHLNALIFLVTGHQTSYSVQIIKMLTKSDRSSFILSLRRKIVCRVKEAEVDVCWPGVRHWSLSSNDYSAFNLWTFGLNWCIIVFLIFSLCSRHFNVNGLFIHMRHFIRVFIDFGGLNVLIQVFSYRTFGL